MDDKCPKCNGSGLVPLPRGMSPGFYRFMGAGCVRRDDGTLLMLCGCRSAAASGGDEDEGKGDACDT